MCGRMTVRAATKRDVARDDGWHFGSLLVVGEAEPEPSRWQRLCAWLGRLIGRG